MQIHTVPRIQWKQMNLQKNIDTCSCRNWCRCKLVNLQANRNWCVSHRRKGREGKGWHTLCFIVAGADEDLAYGGGAVRSEAATEPARLRRIRHVRPRLRPSVPRHKPSSCPDLDPRRPPAAHRRRPSGRGAATVRSRCSREHHLQSWARDAAAPQLSALRGRAARGRPQPRAAVVSSTAARVPPPSPTSICLSNREREKGEEIESRRLGG